MARAKERRRCAHWKGRERGGREEVEGCRREESVGGRRKVLERAEFKEPRELYKYVIDIRAGVSVR